ncbi:FAD-dependent oxidoreductase [Reyranella sp.]|jgi:3-oxosteroid 1-dehydrogenase|uniref:FAD-dependent oxidoreductase n=1 Tax=Reyranella sp. TaxID=1929291 RepID=UPI002F943326
MRDTAWDVVVVGSGAAGLSAALAAAVDGARVLVLEKAGVLGGTTAMSAAGTWVPNNHHMRAAGIEDSVEQTLTYLRATAPPGWQETEDELWQALAENAAPMLRFVEDHTPLVFELVNHPDLYVEAPGGKLFGRMVSPTLVSRYRLGSWWNRVRKSVKPQFFTYKEMIDGVLKDPVRAVLRLGPSLAWRVIAGQVGLGNGLIVGLASGCLKHHCHVLLNADVKRLTVDGGSVTGVEAMIDGKAITIAARKGVVLATGGFDWSPDYMPHYFPGIELIGAPRTNTGDGQRMAAEAGAELAHMDQSNIGPATFTRYEGRRHAQPLYETYAPHCILVNREGKRFVSEGSAALGAAIDERGPDGKSRHIPAWRIFDARYANRLSTMYAAKDPDFVRTADTIEELAGKIGLDPRTLKMTVERFNGWSKEGVDRDFHRGETAWERHYTKDRALATVEKAPFHAAPFLYVSLGTKGGPRTNRHCEVLRPDRSVIAGLYCAGIAMASPIGTKAVGAGTTIGPCLTFGYIAGKAVARRNV